MRILNRYNPYILISLVLPILISTYVCVYVWRGCIQFDTILLQLQVYYLPPHSRCPTVPSLQELLVLSLYNQTHLLPSAPIPNSQQFFLFSKCYTNRIRQYLISEAGLFHTEYFLESLLSCSVFRFVVEQYSTVCMCHGFGDHLIY